MRSTFRIGPALMVAFVAGALSAQQAPLPKDDDYIRPGPVTAKGLAPGMQVKQLSQSPRAFEVTFKKGDDVMAGMNEFAENYHLRTSQVTAVAGFGSALLGWGDPGPNSKGFRKIPINQEVEVVLNGNFTVRNGTPRFHAHAICVFPDGSTKGGHVIEAHVGLTMEAMVQELETEPQTQAAK